MTTVCSQPARAVSAPQASILSVRVPAPAQVAAFDQLLAAQHHRGAGRPAALRVWGPAGYALQDRDLWISGSAHRRVERRVPDPRGSAPCYRIGPVLTILAPRPFRNPSQKTLE